MKVVALAYSLDGKTSKPSGKKHEAFCLFTGEGATL